MPSQMMCARDFDVRTDVMTWRDPEVSAKLLFSCTLISSKLALCTLISI